MSGWLLDSVEIEGFRGINNEGDPLVLQFAHDAVNSVSAPKWSRQELDIRCTYIRSSKSTT